MCTIVAQLVGGALLMLYGSLWPWVLAQCIRCLRIRDLGRYMSEMYADLTTNVTLFSIFKFSLVVVSVPHWVGCMWWLISERNLDGTSLEAPSWTAQYAAHIGTGAFEPRSTTAMESYLMAQ
jgi:hypothetical protein